MSDSLFLNALNRTNKARAPVWLMRQAGRYMPSYRKIRETASLIEMFHQSDLITEVTLLPVEELGVDAAIIFSDILLPLEAAGCELIYENDKPPRVISPSGLIQQFICPSKSQIEDRFFFLIKSIKQLKKILKIPLIGFCAAPFTLASYLLETTSHHLMKKTKTFLYQNEKGFHQLMESLCQLLIDYALMQISAGASVIQIFDSWAGVLDKEQFEKCSCYYLKKIVEGLKPTQVPVIVFTRESSLFAKELCQTGADAISFDWKLPIDELSNVVPEEIALQGNFDPDFLRAPFDVIERKTAEVLRKMEGQKRYIVNLGHGVLPDIPYEGVKCFVDTVKNFNH